MLVFFVKYFRLNHLLFHLFQLLFHLWEAILLEHNRGYYYRYNRYTMAESRIKASLFSNRKYLYYS